MPLSDVDTIQRKGMNRAIPTALIQAYSEARRKTYDAVSRTDLRLLQTTG